MTSRLWAITCYFNPVGYRRRSANYREFRKRLSIPLLAVELMYDEPELGNEDAEILIQRRGRDVMWHKERLLNLAVEALPPECDRVAILDADVVFQTADWAHRIDEALDRYPLCQAFRTAYEAPCDVDPEAFDEDSVPVEHSLAHAFGEGATLPALLDGGRSLRERGICPGLAWAARRELLARHGLYEACIVGGAYLAIAAAAVGEHVLGANFLAMNDAQRGHYREWSEPFHAEVRGRLGFADTTLLHLWHGEIPNRFYMERYQGLLPFGFDPRQDLDTGEDGILRWASDKPGLHGYVKDYFARRREDG